METKVALVTGGASGMGMDYALGLVQRAVMVAFVDVNAGADCCPVWQTYAIAL